MSICTSAFINLDFNSFIYFHVTCRTNQRCGSLYPSILYIKEPVSFPHDALRREHTCTSNDIVFHFFLPYKRGCVSECCKPSRRRLHFPCIWSHPCFPCTLYQCCPSFAPHIFTAHKFFRYSIRAVVLDFLKQFYDENFNLFDLCRYFKNLPMVG